MKNRVCLIFSGIVTLLLLGLLILSTYAAKQNYQDLVIVVPDGANLLPFDLKEVNKLCDEEVSVTYSTNEIVLAEAAGSARSIHLIGTNSSYNEVMEMQIIEGSFWLEEAWTMNSRYVVLNEFAAFQLFGSNHVVGVSFKVGEDFWLVTGVVKDDNRKKAMAYVPASTTNQYPNELLVRTKNSTVMNALSKVGLYESNCKIVEVEAIARLFFEQFLAAFYLLIILFLAFVMGVSARHLKENYKVLKLRYEIMYFGELMANSQRELQMMTIQMVKIILSGTITMLLFRKNLEMILKWKNYGEQIKYLEDGFSQEKIQWLVRYFMSGKTLFLGFLITLVLATNYILKSNRGERI